MSHTNSLAPHISGFSFGQIIVDAIVDFRDGFAQRAEFRKVFNELDTLTDRELADIGIDRGQIRAIAEASANDQTWAR
jgi:uncharacterized protein YjiS (DUF1127 family)